MEISPHKRAFIDFMVRSEVLTFGDFVTKSGRRTPYFINTGRYRMGAQLVQLAEFYVHAIRENLGDAFDVLFGPAYKGIPLAAATAMTLARDHGHHVAYCFDRKESKDHGEGGSFVGHIPTDGERILIIEDVITAGTSIRETVPRLRAVADVKLAGLVVSVDRMERGQGGKPALVEIAEDFAMPVFSIVTIDEVVRDLRGRAIDGRVVLGDEQCERIAAYRREHGTPT